MPAWEQQVQVDQQRAAGGTGMTAVVLQRDEVNDAPTERAVRAGILRNP